MGGYSRRPSLQSLHTALSKLTQIIDNCISLEIWRDGKNQEDSSGHFFAAARYFVDVDNNKRGRRRHHNELTTHRVIEKSTPTPSSCGDTVIINRNRFASSVALE
jgi:hypothetical protein